MHTHANNAPENKSQSAAATSIQVQSSGESSFEFQDDRAEAVAQRKLQEMANDSPQVSQQRSYQAMANNSPQTKQASQLQAIADSNRNSIKYQPDSYRVSGIKISTGPTSFSPQQVAPVQKKEDSNGLPNNLKSGIEDLSGYAMDDVKVHYNSDKPAQLQAHAFAQGSDIHLASGQERHLPHEAWHVVQQKQGRVKATMQMKSDLSKIVQRVAITQAVCSPLVVNGAKLEHQISCTIPGGPNQIFTVTVSEGKHLLESYKQGEVTTPISGINTNTIVQASQATFRLAFQEWADECASQLNTNGTTWNPSTGPFATTTGITFGSDSTGNTHTIHSFPTAGPVTVLTDPQYNLLKRISQAFYRHGKYQSAAGEVNNLLRSVNPDIPIVLGLLGITQVQLQTTINGILATETYQREQNQQMQGFMRGADFNNLFS